MSTHDEDATLGTFGYTQELDRSVGRLASFCLGFAVISATTAVYSGFGLGLALAGPAFVWTFPVAVGIFLVWAVIAGDLASKIPLSGYAYQWTSRLVGPSLGWFTGYSALIGFISGFTGVAYSMAGYLGGLLGLEPTTSTQIWISVAIVLVCVLVNAYGVRLTTALNNAGVALEIFVTVGITIFVGIVVLVSSSDHQGLDYLFDRGEGVASPYVTAWLTSSLACIFGLLGVEAAADIAEETRDARKVIPRTMLYALGAAAAVEFLMYVVFLLAVPDRDTIAASATPISDIMSEQVSPLFADVVVAIALTNILACVLAVLLVATRLLFAMARDNMVPGSSFLSTVSPQRRTPVAAVWVCGRPLHRAADVGVRQRAGIRLHPGHRCPRLLPGLRPDHRRHAARHRTGSVPGGHSGHVHAGRLAHTRARRGPHPVRRSHRCPHVPSRLPCQRPHLRRRDARRVALVGARAAGSAGARRGRPLGSPRQGASGPE